MKPLAWLRLTAGCLGTFLAIGAWCADEIVVGQVAPLSGVLADTGKDMVLGAKLYFDHINEQGGVHGKKIRHVVKDDGYKVDETVRLTKEKVIRALETLHAYDAGGFTVNFSPSNRIGSRFVEITVIGKDGRLLR